MTSENYLDLTYDRRRQKRPSRPKLLMLTEMSQRSRKKTKLKNKERSQSNLRIYDDPAYTDDISHLALPLRRNSGPDKIEAFNILHKRKSKDNSNYLKRYEYKKENSSSSENIHDLNKSKRNQSLECPLYNTERSPKKRNRSAKQRRNLSLDNNLSNNLRRSFERSEPSLKSLMINESAKQAKSSIWRQSENWNSCLAATSDSSKATESEEMGSHSLRKDSKMQIGKRFLKGEIGIKSFNYYLLKEGLKSNKKPSDKDRNSLSKSDAKKLLTRSEENIYEEIFFNDKNSDEDQDHNNCVDCELCQQEECTKENCDYCCNKNELSHSQKHYFGSLGRIQGKFPSYSGIYGTYNGRNNIPVNAHILEFQSYNPNNPGVYKIETTPVAFTSDYNPIHQLQINLGHYKEYNNHPKPQTPSQVQMLYSHYAQPQTKNKNFIPQPKDPQQLLQFQNSGYLVTNIANQNLQDLKHNVTGKSSSSSDSMYNKYKKNNNPRPEQPIYQEPLPPVSSPSLGSLEFYKKHPSLNYETDTVVPKNAQRQNSLGMPYAGNIYKSDSKASILSEYSVRSENSNRHFRCGEVSDSSLGDSMFSYSTQQKKYFGSSESCKFAFECRRCSLDIGEKCSFSDTCRYECRNCDCSSSYFSSDFDDGNYNYYQHQQQQQENKNFDNYNPNAISQNFGKQTTIERFENTMDMKQNKYAQDFFKHVNDVKRSIYQAEIKHSLELNQNQRNMKTFQPDNVDREKRKPNKIYEAGTSKSSKQESTENIKNENDSKPIYATPNIKKQTAEDSSNENILNLLKQSTPSNSKLDKSIKYSDGTIYMTPSQSISRNSQSNARCDILLDCGYINKQTGAIPKKERRETSATRHTNSPISVRSELTTKINDDHHVITDPPAKVSENVKNPKHNKTKSNQVYEEGNLIIKSSVSEASKKPTSTDLSNQKSNSEKTENKNNLLSRKLTIEKLPTKFDEKYNFRYRRDSSNQVSSPVTKKIYQDGKIYQPIPSKPKLSADHSSFEKRHESSSLQKSEMKPQQKTNDSSGIIKSLSTENDTKQMKQRRKKKLSKSPKKFKSLNSTEGNSAHPTISAPNNPDKIKQLPNEIDKNVLNDEKISLGKKKSSMEPNNNKNEKIYEIPTGNENRKSGAKEKLSNENLSQNTNTITTSNNSQKANNKNEKAPGPTPMKNTNEPGKNILLTTQFLDINDDNKKNITNKDSNNFEKEDINEMKKHQQVLDNGNNKLSTLNSTDSNVEQQNSLSNKMESNTENLGETKCINAAEGITDSKSEPLVAIEVSLSPNVAVTDLTDLKSSPNKNHQAVYKAQSSEFLNADTSGTDDQFVQKKLKTKSSIDLSVFSSDKIDISDLPLPALPPKRRSRLRTKNQANLQKQKNPEFDDDGGEKNISIFVANTDDTKKSYISKRRESLENSSKTFYDKLQARKIQMRNYPFGGHYSGKYTNSSNSQFSISNNQSSRKNKQQESKILESNASEIYLNKSGWVQVSNKTGDYDSLIKNYNQPLTKIIQSYEYKTGPTVTVNAAAPTGQRVFIKSGIKIVDSQIATILSERPGFLPVKFGADAESPPPVTPILSPPPAFQDTKLKYRELIQKQNEGQNIKSGMVFSRSFEYDNRKTTANNYSETFSRSFDCNLSENKSPPSPITKYRLPNFSTLTGCSPNYLTKKESTSQNTKISFKNQKEKNNVGNQSNKLSDSSPLMYANPRKLEQLKMQNQSERGQKDKSKKDKLLTPNMKVKHLPVTSAAVKSRFRNLDPNINQRLNSCDSGARSDLSNDEIDVTNDDDEFLSASSSKEKQRSLTPDKYDSQSSQSSLRKQRSLTPENRSLTPDYRSKKRDSEYTPFSLNNTLDRKPRHRDKSSRSSSSSSYSGGGDYNEGTRRSTTRKSATKEEHRIRRSRSLQLTEKSRSNSQKARYNNARLQTNWQAQNQISTTTNFPPTIRPNQILCDYQSINVINPNNRYSRNNDMDKSRSFDFDYNSYIYNKNLTSVGKLDYVDKSRSFDDNYREQSNNLAYNYLTKTTDQLKTGITLNSKTPKKNLECSNVASGNGSSGSSTHTRQTSPQNYGTRLCDHEMTYDMLRRRLDRSPILNFSRSSEDYDYPLSNCETIDGNSGNSELNFTSERIYDRSGVMKRRLTKINPQLSSPNDSSYSLDRIQSTSRDSITSSGGEMKPLRDSQYFYQQQQQNRSNSGSNNDHYQYSRTSSGRY